MDIENLEINVKTNAGNASKELGSLSDALERLKGAVKGSFNSKGLSNLASSIADLTNAAQGAGETANVLNAIANALKALSGVGKVSIPSNIGTAITNLATATASIDPDVTQRLNDFASVLINLSNVGQIIIPSSLAKQIEAIGAAAAAITPEALDSLDRLVSTMSQLGGASMGQGFTESVSDATGQVNALNEAVDGLNGNLEKINGTSISVRNVGTAAKKAAGHAGGLLNSLKRIALYRILRTILKEIGQAFNEGLKAAYNYSAKMTGEVHRFASSLDSLTSASNQMKGQLGSAFAGLLTAIAPVLEQIINAVTSAFNAISQLLAAFTGGTYMKAVRVQTSYGDAASSTASSINDAADAQKELNKQLMSFDEINKLDEPKSSSGSGGTGGNGGAGNGVADAIQFVTANVPDIIKDAIANADFTQLGSIVGQKIKDALDGIEWDEIKESAKKVAKSIGTFINGFFETPGLSQTIADTVTSAIDTAFEFINTFLENTHWDSIGKFLSEAIQEGIHTFPGEQIGRFISDAICAGLDFATGFVDAIEPKTLAEDIKKQLIKVIDNIKVQEIIEKTTTLIDKILTKGSELVEEFFIGLADDITGWALDADGNVDWDKIKEAFKKSVKKAFDLVEPIAELAEKWPDIFPEALRDVFSKVSLVSQILKLFGPLEDEKTWKKVGAAIETAIKSPFEAGVKGAEAAVGGLQDWIKDIKFEWDPLHGKFGLSMPDKPIEMYVLAKAKELALENEDVGVTANASKLVDKTMGGGVINDATAVAARLRDGTGGGGVINNVTANAPKVTVADKKVSTEATSPFVTIANKLVNLAANAPSVNVANKTVEGMTAKAPSVKVANKTVEGMTAKAPGVNVANKTVEGITARAESVNWEKKKNLDKNLSVKAIASKITPAKGKGIIDGIKATVSNITLTGKAKSVWDKLMGKAKGGVYQNGRWSNIPQYAGGTLNAGSMFIAGEAGPEIVGHVGGRTEVLNASQIASAIYTAVVSAMDNSSNNQPVNLNVYLDGRVVAENSLGHYRNMVRAGGDPLAGIV